MKKVGILAAAAVLLAGTAWAVPVSTGDVMTLDATTLATFTAQGSTGAAPLFYGSTGSTPQEADFTAVWGNYTGAVSATVGLSGLGGLDWSSSDAFGLKIENRNENPWNFYVTLKDTGGHAATSAPVSIVNGTSGAIFVDLSAPSFDASAVDGVFVTVAAAIPLPGNDRTAEFAVKPVPEPATMLLLGGGLLGLAGVQRRRGSKES